MFDPKAMIKTIANADVTPEMTSQQIFDIVATHLFAQGDRAMSEGASCVYRGVNGTKCAVGVLVPDSVYKEQWDTDGIDAHILLVDNLDDFKNLSVHYQLLRSLQTVHDLEHNWISTEKMHSALNHVISLHKLSGIDTSKLEFADR